MRASSFSLTAHWPSQPGYFVAMLCRSLQLLRPLSGALGLCQSLLAALPRTAARVPLRLLQRPGGELGNLRYDAPFIPAVTLHVPAVCIQWACETPSNIPGHFTAMCNFSVPCNTKALEDCWCSQEDWGELYSGKRAPGIFVLDLETLKVQRLTGTPADSSVGQPVWSPSGAHISCS